MCVFHGPALCLLWDDSLTVYRTIKSHSLISGQVEFLLSLCLLRLLTPRDSVSLACSPNGFPFPHQLPLLRLPTRPIAFAPYLNIRFGHLFTNTWMLLEAQMIVITFNGPQEPNLPAPGRSKQDAVSVKRSTLLSEQAAGMEPLSGCAAAQMALPTA